MKTKSYDMLLAIIFLLIGLLNFVNSDNYSGLAFIFLSLGSFTASSQFSKLIKQDYENLAAPNKIASFIFALAAFLVLVFEIIR
jgi:uncharacterized membrane protein